MITLLSPWKELKFTLINILYGFYQPDQGEICIQDQPAKITNPRDANKKGVGYACTHSETVR
jgi:simple sugar transport system ATP-binding protein